MNSINGNNEIIRRIRNGRVAVCGVGISNLPLIDFLIKLGGNTEITARDKKSREQIGEVADRLEKLGVCLILGERYLDNINEDVIFRTPGIRPDIPQFSDALARGAILTSEMELFLELTPATVIGITGSDGKTTTTALTHKMLEEQCRADTDTEGGKGVCLDGYCEGERAARVYIGGNFGWPLLPLVGEMTERDYAVVELSSFQLSTMKRSPRISAITNITPNHLDWHRNMDEYRDAKKNICSHSGAARLTVNAENEATNRIGVESPLEVTFFSSRRCGFDNIVPAGKAGARAVFERDGMIVISDGTDEEPVIRVSDILLPGRHNVENYMTAIANVYGYVSRGVIEKVAKTFPGVEHRLEFVRELDGVKYYNGSIDSSPTRTAAAISALPVKPVVICGGYDKKIPFAPLADALIEGAAAVVLTGATAEKILSSLTENPGFDPAILPVVRESDFEAAISAARGLAAPGGIVLLSPACASFDRFKNFMERGELFKRVVNSFESTGGIKDR